MNTELLDQASERCKNRGTQLTPIRRDVLDLLYASDNGLKAYDLLEKIKHKRSNATPPTVYRALDFLMAQGFVHKIESLNQFIACRHDSHSLPGLFMVCRRCSKVTELHDPSLARALLESMRQAGNQPDCHEVEIASICPECLSSDQGSDSPGRRNATGS